MMKITAKLLSNLVADVTVIDAPTGPKLTVLYYAIFQALNQHDSKAFDIAMDAFLSAEIDKENGGKEND